MDPREMQHKKNNKRKRKRKTFLHCFKHVDKLEDSVGKNNSPTRCPEDKFMLRLVPVGDPNVSSSSPGSDGSSNARKKKSGFRSFSRALKSVLFETSHGRSHRNRKLKPGNENERLRESKLEDVLSHQNCWSEDDTDVQRENSWPNASSSSSGALSSSIVTSMTSRSSYEGSNTLKLKPIECRQKLRSSWCLLLLSLFSLIFFGKVFAIFCTSTWLLFVPRWNAKGGSANVDMSSEEYKKKVILEGLLKRDRSRADSSQYSQVGGEQLQLL